MALFESMLVLLIIAVLLMQVSRWLGAPYPSMLAFAGMCVAALPWAPHIDIDPHLALVLFIAPALFDSAYDTSPRELRRYWLPLIALVVVAVVLTTAAVAWVGWWMAGLPLSAAIALGAIVAPPDAAAASAVLNQFKLPRRMISILQGESLLNDAVALLIFSTAVFATTSAHLSMINRIPIVILAVPGGALLGWLLGKLYLAVAPRVAGTLSSSIVEFVLTFGAWIIAERFHLSAIISVVVFAMTVARYGPSRQSPRDRIHSYSVWQATVFILNVLAFLLMGLQARSIVSRLATEEIWRAIGFATVVLVTVIVVRMLWGYTYVSLVRWRPPANEPKPSKEVGLLISWCGMRGLVTLATAFALPQDFPGRDLIVLSAFAVVIGTLVIQGLTIRPLIKFLNIEQDDSLAREISYGRTRMIEAGLAALALETSEEALSVRAELVVAQTIAADPYCPQCFTSQDQFRLMAIAAERKAIAECREAGRIDDDVFHRLEEELDWAELSAAQEKHFELLNT